MLHNPCILGDPQAKGGEIRIGWAHKWSEMLHHPCILGDPQAKGGEIRIGRAHKWTEMLHNPCILEDPQQRGQNQSIKRQKQTKKQLFPSELHPDWNLEYCQHWGLNP